MLELPGKEIQKTARSAMVVFENVNFSVGKTKLIHNISCTLDGNAKTVVMGANGAGKSLFLRLLAGLLKPDSGLINTTGTGTGTGADAAANTGKSRPAIVSMVFQKPVLLRRTVAGNLGFVLKNHCVPQNKRKRIIQETLTIAKLQNLARNPARSLSGGEQQRLALARAIAISPDILLLDEATANLDPASTFIVEKMVDEISRAGTKVIFITHDVRQAKRIGDDVLFFHEGQIMTHKPAVAFFRDPGSPEAQAYLDGRILNSTRVFPDHIEEETR